MKMSSANRAWIVAASVGAVEALKDQGICRWNYAFRHAKNNLRSYTTQANKLSPAVTTAMKQQQQQEKSKQSEESLRTVMYLSCWAPN